MNPSSWDAKIGALAAKQGGYVTRQQLLNLGLTKDEIGYRTTAKRLIRVHQGVYAVGHIPTRPEARAAGALLACGPRSALSHSSAASVWGIIDYWQEPFELIVASTHRPPGCKLHHSAKLITRDVTTRQRLRVTSAARTILDLSPTQTAKRRTRVFNDLRLRKLLTLSAVDDVLARNPTHPGRKSLQQILNESQAEPTRSDLEDAFQALLRKYRIAIPRINIHVGPYRVDAVYGTYEPSLSTNTNCLIVELDGWETHKTREAFARDRRQDSDILTDFGIPTVRFTYFQTTDDAKETATQLDTLLRQRGIA